MRRPKPVRIRLDKLAAEYEGEREARRFAEEAVRESLQEQARSFETLLTGIPYQGKSGRP